MLLCQHAPFRERNPCALVLSISTLNFLMDTLLHFSFQNSCPGRFIEAGDFENMCGIDPVVGPTSHDVVGADFELVDGHLQAEGQSNVG